MHTTICAFDERADAEQAMELLVQAGFPPYDMHVEFRAAPAAAPRTRWGSRLPADGDADARTLEAFGRFMATLVGEEEGDGSAAAVERGSYVLVVDARSEDQAELVRRLLRALAADDLHLLDDVQRPPGLRYADHVRKDLPNR